MLSGSDDSARASADEDTESLSGGDHNDRFEESASALAQANVGFEDDLATLLNEKKIAERKVAKIDGSLKKLAVPATPQLKSIGPRFRAILIGNNKYYQRSLRGCHNDIDLVYDYLANYIGVPEPRITVRKDATRKTIIDQLYGLKADDIQPGDNILVYFAGHGTFYRFESSRIEAICPSDRGRDPTRKNSSPNIPDISDRELNNILSQVSKATGSKITFIADCCHSGGLDRYRGDDEKTRSVPQLPPSQGEPSGGDSQLTTAHLIKAADGDNRRGNEVSIGSPAWKASTSDFVLLAACGHQERAKERAVLGPVVHGVFTWALVNMLKSNSGQKATYASITKMVGDWIGNECVAKGDRRESAIWFQGGVGE